MTIDNQTSVGPNDRLQTTLTPGVILAGAREQLGLSIEDVASSLKLRGSVIEAIENDDYSKIARHVFARGYLRAYAHLVHVDPNAVVASFNASNFMGDETIKMLWKTSRSTVATNAPSKKSNPVKWLFMLAGVCLILFTGMWINANRMNTPNSGLKMALTLKEPSVNVQETILVEQDSLDDSLNSKGKLS